MRSIKERMSVGLHYHRKQLRARLAELKADAESSGFAQERAYLDTYGNLVAVIDSLNAAIETVVRDIIDENKDR